MGRLRRNGIGLFVEPEDDVKEQAENEQADCQDDWKQYPIVEKFDLLLNWRCRFLEPDLAREGDAVRKSVAREQRRKTEGHGLSPGQPKTFRRQPPRAGSLRPVRHYFLNVEL